MASVNKSAAAKRAAAEAEAVPVKFKFLGATFTGPPTLPGTFAFDMAAAAAGDEGAIFTVVSDVLGDDQLVEVRELLAQQEVTDGGIDLLGNLFTTLIDAYGIDEGE